jgi:PAS domain S-box-containing protein
MGSTATDKPAPSGQPYGDPGVELLLEAGVVLAGSLEPEVTMRQVAGLTVPRLADLCVIDLRADDGSIQGVAVVARDPELERGLVELRDRFPLDPAGEHPVARVLRSGATELVAEMTSPMLRSYARSATHATFMVEHGYRSAIVAPLVARDHTLGALSVLRMRQREPFAERDRELVAELARRAALAIDNGRLYSELRMLEQRLEAILAGLAEAITMVDEQGRTVYANAAAAKLLRVSTAGELVGDPPGSLIRRFHVFDEDGRELELADMPSRRLLRGEPSPAPLLVRNVVPETGDERWLIVRASALNDPASGSLSHVVSVFEDVTELKRAELAERLLADASRILASSPTLSALAEIAGFATREIADWCAIDLVGEPSGIERVATRAARSSTILAGDETTPEELADRSGVGEVVRTGEARVWSAEPMRDGSGHDEADAPLAGAAAVLVAPIGVGRNVIGAITVARSRPSRPFSEADVAVVLELGRRMGIAAANARRYSERSHIAHVLQQALLPQSLPDSDALEVRAVYEAAGELNEVGGDFYDVFEYDHGAWLVLIGDVCGKGAQAAGVTALARHTLRAAAITGQPPAQMLDTLHRALMHQSDGLEPCTVCVVLVRPDNGRAKLTIALGGHHPPLLIGARDAVSPIGRAGTLLGAVDPIDVHETTAELRHGETLLLYTDGVIDAGRPLRPLGDHGLIDLCAGGANRPLGELLEHIRDETVSRAGGSLRDDVALLAVRLRSDGSTDGG